MPSLFITVCVFISIVTQAWSTPVDITARDVYNPEITSPTSGLSGRAVIRRLSHGMLHCSIPDELADRSSMFRNHDNIPTQVTNPRGTVLLRINGRSDVAHPLATGFDVTTSESITFTVPVVTPATTYQIVLMGDSGNFSDEFEIQCPEELA
ncbi:hypothetical protein BDP27DRAFT_534888 [Rhodocollybia butyracea]|uniref:Uncharacterized protein n=1 Tax=Rhodocollybia butyracea TaxID=206335 RepID=A0A9P5UAL7_9AGAR|nr:hypothetical protein BDP27DRAFT_534888 [Rhodocollybia butyracea]